MTAPPKFLRFEAVAFTALFTVLISLPLLKQLTVGEPDTSSIEKRAQVQRVFFTGNWKWRIKNFPQLFDLWYSDHFGFRLLLLQGGGLLSVNWFHVSPHVQIGKDGWLFYILDPPLFTESLDTQTLAKWKSYLEHRQSWLAARGIKYLFVVPPDKDIIYPEFLPSTSRKPPAELPVDQLARYLRDTHSSVEILSLVEPALAAKHLEQQRLFYKHDGHWNSLGGFYGYQAIILRLQKWFPALKPKSRAGYRLVLEKENGMDLAQMAGLPDFTGQDGPVLQPLVPEQVITRDLPVSCFGTIPFVTQLQDADGLPRAVMLRDSFTCALAPYLSLNFSRITYFWPTVGTSITLAEEQTLADTIRKEKPDVFIEEHIQRSLPDVPDEKIMFGGAGTPSHGANNP